MLQRVTWPAPGDTLTWPVLAPLLQDLTWLGLTHTSAIRGSAQLLSRHPSHAPLTALPVTTSCPCCTLLSFLFSTQILLSSRPPTYCQQTTPPTPPITCLSPLNAFLSPLTAQSCAADHPALPTEQSTTVSLSHHTEYSSYLLQQRGNAVCPPLTAYSPTTAPLTSPLIHHLLHRWAL